MRWLGLEGLGLSLQTLAEAAPAKPLLTKPHFCARTSLAFKCTGSAGEGDEPRAWLREPRGAVSGYFGGESPSADVSVAHMGTTGHSAEPQTCGHQECGPCTAATLTQLHSFYRGKNNSMETGRFNGVGLVVFHSFFTEFA